jgi:hypothetical protein
VAVTAPLDAAGHDPGDEDQAERQPANWWLYQHLARGRSEPHWLQLCGSRLDDAGGTVVLEVAGRWEMFRICGELRCSLALEATAALQRRRTA